MTGTMTAALTKLLADRRKWDEPPGLYLVYARNDGVEIDRVSVIPQQAFDRQPAPEVLALFAVHVAGVPGTPPACLGVVFRFEGWGTRDPDYMAGGTGRRPKNDPNRVEQRVAHAVAGDGVRYLATQNRGSTEVTVLKEDATHPMRGSIVRALTIILAVLEKAAEPRPAGRAGEPGQS